MRIFYIISVIFLLIMFMLLKKQNRVLSIVREIVYSVSLLLCYNTLVVFLVSFILDKGSILLYSIINIFVSFLMLIIIIKRKEIQKYKFNRKEALFVISFVLVMVLIVYYKNGGISKINYLLDSDSAVHYKSAYTFSKELVLLNKSNSLDIVFNYFCGMMPISYINGGIFISIFNSLEPYQSFIIYDSLNYVLCSLLFLVTLLEIFKTRKKLDYLYIICLSMLYSLAYPLNSFLFGFSYLTIGIMVTNLLVLTIFRYQDSLEEYIGDKILILLIITFGVFCSYYLFVPSIYLSLGIYYIMLKVKNKINIKEMFLYGGFTLVLPFIMGCISFVMPVLNNGNTVRGVLSLYGGCYDNKSTIYFYIMFATYLMFRLYKGNVKFSYFNLVLYIHTFYIAIMLVLFFLKIVGLYYLYKLFFVYFIFVIIYIGGIFINNRKYLYMVSSIILLLIIVSINVGILSKTNIYSYNVSWISYDGLLNKEELELTQRSLKYQDICLYNKTFPVIGSHFKNYWFYVITDSIPVVYGDSSDMRSNLDKNTLTLSTFDYLTDYRCAVYYNEGIRGLVDEDKYDILFKNKGGAIIRRTDKNQAILEKFLGGNSFVP